MNLCHHVISLKTFPTNDLLHPTLYRRRRKPLTHTIFISSSSTDSDRVTLHNETLKTLEWNSICKQLSAFTSTPTGFSLSRNGNVPIGGNRNHSQKLLDQTTAAVSFPMPLNFSGIEDVTEILNSSVSGQLLTVSELCATRRTLRAAKALLDQLVSNEGSSNKYSPLLEILQNCDFQMDLEQKIGFCIDCNLSIILDQASEELEIIRSERKRNMENLDSLLKRESTRIFQSGGIDRPLITKRRSRMCVGIRATHRTLLRDGVILNVSSSGATYFMEPKEAVELNNMEVKLSNAEKAEERAILSMLTCLITESESEMKFLLERIIDVDLAFARAAYARWMNGVCPVLSLDSVDIGGIHHPLLLESSLRSLSDIFESRSGCSVQSDNEFSNVLNSQIMSEGNNNGFPVPIDIQIGRGTKIVVISGPNTGGKTASMKTLGIASLMSKAGMYLPAKNDPKIPWFDLILADVGDHQSLEENLSTFSGHISRICKILQVSSKASLVLIDEIGSGTDPWEGVALSASILKYLADRVGLAVVTTHYADLSRLKENDDRFGNAAMEFSLNTLKPTYRILWGSSGDSNALSIAKSIGFDRNIIERAQNWVDRLMPEKQSERKGMLYRSLMEERNRLEIQARRAASLHSQIINIYNEIQEEAEGDITKREAALKAKEMYRAQRELKEAKSGIEAVVREFESTNPDQFNSVVKKSESAIASIIQAHKPRDDYVDQRTDNDDSYIPQCGEQVHVKGGLGDKLATVVEAPEEDDQTVLVQYGKIKVRVKKSDVIPSFKKTTTVTRRVTRSESESVKTCSIQTSKNTVDLRGMRVEEASQYLRMAIAGKESQSLLFIIHGMGTGAIKECALQILKNNPQVSKFEQESPMNYGCTVAYII